MRTRAFETTASTMNAIVADYRRQHRSRNSQERRWFELQRSFRDALRLAGRAEGPRQHRLSHQRRLSRETLRRCEATLLAAEKQLASAVSFSALHSLVESLILSIRGVGELMVYDTAVRLGAHRGLEPKDVYLHAGTRAGAKALGLNHRARSIPRRDLPAPLRRIPATELEDILCIYKDVLKGRKGVSSRNGWC
jgi:hypothetical protein